MKEQMVIGSIGTVEYGEGCCRVVLEKPFREALRGLEGFSHLQILWWGHLYATEEARSMVKVDKPYTKGPESCGILATRSPVRPNPILLSTVEVIRIDPERGVIELPWIDAEPGTPVVDIKPYHPSSDRIRDARTPGWCSHWPQWYEDSESFDWEAEFNF